MAQIDAANLACATSALHADLHQLPEFLDRVTVGLARLLFGVLGVLPIEAARVGRDAVVGA